MRSEALLALLWLAAAPAQEQHAFPPITPEHQAIERVEAYPNAAAVVLFKDGRVSFFEGESATLMVKVTVDTRIKVLTEAGKKYGDLSILDHPFLQLGSLSARTVTADGTVHELPREHLFKSQTSKKEQLTGTSVTLPAVEVGSMLDFHYELSLVSPYLLEPWMFQQEIPVLRSQVVYSIPQKVAARKYLRNPPRLAVHEETSETEDGVEVRAWAVNIAPHIDEPFSYASSDLATRLAIVPERARLAGGRLIQSYGWAPISEVLQMIFAATQGNDGKARRQAKTLLAPLESADLRRKAEALYRFVRDQIATEDGLAFELSQKPDVDQVLSKKAGTPLEKALLLRSLLAVAGIEGEVVLAAGRSSGALDPEIATLWPLDRPLVRINLERAPLHLDPSTPCLSFGQLQHDYEGGTLLRPKLVKLEALAQSLPAASQRHSQLELALDQGGAWTGSGSLTSTGHHATFLCEMGRKADDDLESWQEYLQKKLPAFRVEGVERDSASDDPFVLRYRLRQEAEEVLGDEASFEPSRPFGPVDPLPVQDSKSRRSVLVLPFADIDDLVLALSWPAGWRLAAQPAASSIEGTAGSFTGRLELDAEARTLTYRRRFEVKTQRFATPQEIQALIDLYATAERHDAQALDFVHP